MRRALLVGAAVALLAAPVFAQSLGFGFGMNDRGKGSGGGGSPVPIAIDGTPGHSSTSASSTTVTISPKARSVVLVCVTVNTATVSSITSANLTFANRAVQGGADNIELWYAIVGSAALSNEVLTVNLSGSQFLTVDAWAVSGADTVTVFDPNVSLPAKGAATPLTISTTNANDMVIGCARGGVAAPAVGVGYTLIKNPSADFQLTEYQIFSAAQTNLSVTAGQASNGAIADAIKRGS